MNHVQICRTFKKLLVESCASPINVARRNLLKIEETKRGATIGVFQPKNQGVKEGTTP